MENPSVAGMQGDIKAVLLSTIQRLEKADQVRTASAWNLEAVQRALEGAGVDFTNGDAPGVHLKPGVAK